VTLDCNASAETETADGVLEVAHDQVEGVIDVSHGEFATTEGDCVKKGFVTNRCFQTEAPL
jgi:hypothetical protein